MDTVECAVIGGGVIGLAVARALARAGRETVVLEAERLFGSVTSSRNSEVIHAGIYYPKGSRKAVLCVAGKHQLYDYCRTHHVEHRRCGKLIVATDPSQDGELEHIKKAAAGNGVDDLTALSRAEAQALEPALACTSALLSPSTGIIDSHGFMLSLLGEAEDHGAMIAYGARVARMDIETDGIAIALGGEDAPTLKARLIVNSAGLDAPRMARALKGFPEAWVPPTYYAKGSYFTLSGRSPFSRLIYPVPEPGGLGVHLTIDLGGQARFGPDVEWTDAPNYDVDPHRADKFYRVVRAYWPGLRDGALQPGYAGVRPKISGPGEPAADFRIDGSGTHGVKGVINLFGIESPGLTAALAIADEVAKMVREDLDG